MIAMTNEAKNGMVQEDAEYQTSDIRRMQLAEEVHTVGFGEPLLLLLSLEAAAGSSSEADDLLLSLSLPSDESRAALFLRASLRSRSVPSSSASILLLARSLAEFFSERLLCLADRLASASLDDSLSEGSFLDDDLPWSAFLSRPPRTLSSRSFLDESVFFKLHKCIPKTVRLSDSSLDIHVW